MHAAGHDRPTASLALTFVRPAIQTVSTVDGGERAVIFDRFRGVLPEAVGEGTHFRLPWVQTPHIMEIRTRPRTINSVTGTKGG